MKLKPFFLLVLVLSFLVASPNTPILLANDDSSQQSDLNSWPEQDSLETIEDTGSNSDPKIDSIQDINRDSVFSLSDAGTNGVIDPLLLEERGLDVQTSGIQTARTDYFPIPSSTLFLDGSEGWRSDQIRFDIDDLKSLYLLNGTFEDGINGTNVDWSGSATNHPWGWDASRQSGNSEQHQYASYVNSSQKYVALKNEGKVEDLQDEEFKHYEDTDIFWFQDMALDPYTELFNLSFSLQYMNGPMGTTYDHRFRLVVKLAGHTVWEIDPTVSPYQRGEWYDIDPISIDLNALGLEGVSTLKFEIGLEIYNRDFTAVGTNGDCRDINDARYLSFLFDNIEFYGAIPPEPESVQLKAEVQDVPAAGITGDNGRGLIVIHNSNYWSSDYIHFQFSANDTVSFSYEARFLMNYRWTNTSWTLDPNKVGVSYTVEYKESPNLEAYFYLGTQKVLSGQELLIQIPNDWENVSIYNPMLTDVTIQCTESNGLITIPGELLNVLGWWKLELMSPNYANSIKIQTDINGWIDSNAIQVGNSIRTSVVIASDEDAPENIENLGVNWFLPNGSIWYSELLSSTLGGTINGTPLLIDSSNSSSGMWLVSIDWNNGTEIAFSNSIFSVYHNTSLNPVNPRFETRTGMILAASVELYDSDIGMPILSGGATVSANWTGGTVMFSPNPSKGRWDADFETSSVGEGSFIVQVNASIPFHVESSCSFIIDCTSDTQLDSPSSPWISTAWGEIAPLTFSYESYNHDTELWNPIQNISGDVVFWCNWTAGWWSVVAEATPGIYRLDIDTSAMQAGTWVLNITCEKPFHEPQQISLALIVDSAATHLEIFSETSVQIQVDGSYNLKMHFQDSGGLPIPEASVFVEEITPEVGMMQSIPEAVPGQQGNYSIEFSPQVIGTYSIRVIASKENYIDAAATLVLEIISISSTLTILGEGTDTTANGVDYDLKVRYLDMYSSPIQGATVVVSSISPSTGLISSNSTEIGGEQGNYSIVLTPNDNGIYTVVVESLIANYSTSEIVFVLEVIGLASTLIFYGDEYNELGLSESFVPTFGFHFLNETGISDATLEVIYWTGPDSGISWTESSIVPDELGNYTIEFGFTVTGTYLVTVKASKPNLQSSTTSFFAIVREMDTQFSVVDGASVVLGLGSSYSLHVRYTNTTDGDISSANVWIASVTPAEGLDFSVSLFLGNGTYAIQLTPTIAGTYTVIIEASAINYQTQFGSFTITASPIASFLTVTSSSVPIALDQSFPVLLQFNNDSLGGLDGASITVLSISPAIGLSYGDVTELGDGSYSILLTPNLKGTFDIAFRATLANHQNGTAAFTLIVTEIPTELKSADEISSTIVPYQTIYDLELVLQRTDTSENVSGASLDIRITPSDSLFYTITEESDHYVVELESLRTGTWVLLLTASCINHMNSSMQFIFEVVNLETTIVGASPPNLLTVRESYSFGLRYNCSQYDTIENASISVAGLAIDEISWIQTGNGWYNFTIQPKDVGTYSDVSIRFNKLGYAEAIIVFTFIVDRIPLTLGPDTTLDETYSTVEGSILSIVIEIMGQGTHVSDVTVLCEVIELDQNSTYYFETLEEVAYGIYSIDLVVPNALDAGYVIRITTVKQDYQTLIIESYLASRLAACIIGPDSLISDFYNITEGNILSITVHVIDVETGSYLTQANAQYLISNASGIVLTGFLTESDAGVYETEIVVPSASDVAYELSIFIVKIHCQSLELNSQLVSHKLRMELGEGTLLIQDTSIQFSEQQIILELIDSSSHERITGAVVIMEIIDSKDEIILSLESEELNGLYVTNMTVPEANVGAYWIVFRVHKEHYQDWTIERLLVSIVDPNERVSEMIGLLTIGAFASGAIVLSTGTTYTVRRAYKKRKVQRALEILALKDRFADAKNIIGVIILMRDGGLPVYSKAFRGEFEESILSGFISAITSFRMELQEGEKLWKSIPISDIVTAVQTKSLICALMTFHPPSKRQIENLESFSKIVGKLHDAEFHKSTGFTAELEVLRSLDNLATEKMDMQLLKPYVDFVSSENHKEMKFLSQIFSTKVDDESWTPESLIKKLIETGLNEHNAYRTIITAIDSKQLVEDRVEDEYFFDETHELTLDQKKKEGL